MTIGITCSYCERDRKNLTEKQLQNLEDYRLALQDAGAGGNIIYLPQDNPSSEKIREIAKQESCKLQGLILSGGANLPPQIYDATPGPFLEATVPPLRPAFEKAMVEVMLSQNKPVFGICLGSQVLNVINGGTLLQDIPALVPNAIPHREAMHEVRTEPESFLREWISDSFEVASYHHQCVQRLAPSARVAAKTQDGVIEAIEFPQQYFCVGVQWHPEKTRQSASTQILFRKFVEACG